MWNMESGPNYMDLTNDVAKYPESSGFRTLGERESKIVKNSHQKD